MTPLESKYALARERMQGYEKWGKITTVTLCKSGFGCNMIWSLTSRDCRWRRFPRDSADCCCCCWPPPSWAFRRVQSNRSSLHFSSDRALLRRSPPRGRPSVSGDFCDDGAAAACSARVSLSPPCHRIMRARLFRSIFPSIHFSGGEYSKLLS